ncbi:hypothetical protein PR048_008069 [Dryococelus australis]|uniref:Uncharacterized protein n=1 Tax=Dryococelus australis TaxID=614101 RepID=A0ABQ9HWD3_9NEOP|nr:hypothetical protein PR048_008069 [Dryococelus australis]
MEQRMNERAGETGDPRDDPPTSGIIRHNSHMRKSGSEPVGNRTRFTYSRRGGNGRSARKPADQRHRPARFPLAKIRGATLSGIEPGLPWWETSSLTAQPPRPNQQVGDSIYRFVGIEAVQCWDMESGWVRSLPPFYERFQSSPNNFPGPSNHPSMEQPEGESASVTRLPEGRGSPNTNPISLEWLHLARANGLRLDVNEEIWAAHNIEVLRADEGVARSGVRNTKAEKTTDPRSSGRIRTCKNQYAIPLGIERGPASERVIAAKQLISSAAHSARRDLTLFIERRVAGRRLASPRATTAHTSTTREPRAFDRSHRVSLWFRRQ